MAGPFRKKEKKRNSDETKDHDRRENNRKGTVGAGVRVLLSNVKAREKREGK